MRSFPGKDLSIYFVFGVIAKLFPMLAGVVLAYLLNPVEYGESVLFISMVSVFSAIISFGLPSLIVKDRVVLENEAFNRLLTSSMTLMLGLAVISYCLLIALGGHLGLEVINRYTFLIVFSAYCLGVHSLFLKIYIADKKSFFHGCLDLVKSTLVACLGLGFVYFSETRSADDRIIGLSIGYQILFLFLCLLLTQFFGKPTIQLVRRCFEFGLRVIPQIISNLIKMGADKFLISLLFVKEELGIYSFIFLVSSGFMVLGNAVNNFYAPRSFNFYKNKDLLGLTKLRIKLNMFLALSFMITLVFLYIYFEFFSPKDYETTTINIVLVASSFLFQSIYFLYAKSFLYYEKMFILGLANLLCVALYIIIISFATHLGPYLPISIYSLVLLIFVWVFGKQLERKENAYHR